MIEFRFDPLDTLFFRDGSPFNSGELQSHANSIFPPSPATLGGAVRACLARSMGWDEAPKGGNWDSVCRSALGSGEETGELDLVGPFVSLDENLLTRCPANLAGRVDEKQNEKCISELAFLTLSDSAFETDLGPVRLPQLPPGELGREILQAEWWISIESMCGVVKGDLPKSNDLIHESKIFNREKRVGINRCPDSHSTKEHALFTPKHVRPRSNVQLVMYAANNAGLKLPAKDVLSPVGGEARSCWVAVKEDQHGVAGLPRLSCADEKAGEYAVHVLTPMSLEFPIQPGGKIAGLPGSVMSACLPKADRLGGWDTFENRPLAMAPYVPAGSVIYMNRNTNDEMPPNESLLKLGQRNQWGFGAVALGVVPKQ